MVKENIQVDKLLQPRLENEELDYPTEPHYEPALSDETTAAERSQREQRNVKRRTGWQNSCKDIEDHKYITYHGKKQITKQKPHIPLTRNTSNKHFPPKIPTHRHSKMHNRRTSRTTQRIIHTNKEWNIWQISILPMPTKRRRITRSIPLTNQKTRISLQLGTHGGKPCQEHLHTRNDQPANPNGFIIRGTNTIRDTIICTSTKKRTRKPTENEKHFHKYTTSKPMVRKKPVHKTTEQGPNSPNSTIRTNSRLPTLWQQISPWPLKRLPRKERNLQNMQENRALRKNSGSQRCHHVHNTTHNNADNKTIPDNKHIPVTNKKKNNQLVQRKTSQKMRNINEEEVEDIHNSTEETIDPESTCYIREMMEDWQNTTNFIHSVKFTKRHQQD